MASQYSFIADIIIIMFTVITVNLFALFVLYFLSSFFNISQNIFSKKITKPFYKPNRIIKYLIFGFFVVRLVLRNTLSDFYGGPLEINYLIDYILEPIVFLFLSGLYKEFISGHIKRETLTKSTTKCSICHSELEINDKFCPYCGNEVKKSKSFLKRLERNKDRVHFKKWSYKKLLLIFAMVLVFYTSIVTFTAQRYLETDRNENAYSWLSLAPWVSLVNHDYFLYTKAKSLLEQKEVNEAYQIFVELDNYKNSNVLEKKIANYINYSYLPSGIDKYNAFIRLGDFIDAKDKANEQIPFVYEEALKYYYDLDVDKAYDSLKLIQDFSDARYYVFAIDILKRARIDRISLSLSSYLQELSVYDMDINLGPIIFGQSLIDDYLDGKWFSYDGSTIEFNKSENTFNFSKFNLSSGSYQYLYEGLFNINKDNFSLLWEYIDMNSFKIHSNGNTYFYYRN